MEVLGITKQAVETVQTYIQTGAPPQPQPAPWQQQPRVPEGNPNGGQWTQPPAYGQHQPSPQYDPDQPITFGQFQQLASQFAQQSVAPQLQTMAQTSASIVYETVQREDGPTFQRYGPEINALLARVPRENWTIDTVRQVVRIVKADHLDELARERAAQLVNEQFPTLRSGGAPGTPISPSHAPADSILNNESIPESVRERMRQTGVTEQMARDFCAANGLTLKDYADMLTKQTAITERMFRTRD